MDSKPNPILKSYINPNEDIGYNLECIIRNENIFDSKWSSFVH